MNLFKQFASLAKVYQKAKVCALGGGGGGGGSIDLFALYYRFIYFLSFYMYKTIQQFGVSERFLYLKVSRKFTKIDLFPVGVKFIEKVI